MRAPGRPEERGLLGRARVLFGARMNLPGRAEGNWGWRCTEDMPTLAAFQWLHGLTKTSTRASLEFDTLPERQGARP